MNIFENTFDVDIVIDKLEEAQGNLGCLEDALVVQYNYLSTIVGSLQVTEVSPLLAFAKTLRAVQEDLEKLLSYVS